jgi:hypothetical protein
MIPNFNVSAVECNTTEVYEWMDAELILFIDSFRLIYI